MDGYVSFDTVNTAEDQNHIEGCYRLGESEWKILYFTHTIDGEMWSSPPDIDPSHEFESGAIGLAVIIPVWINLNNNTVKRMLAEIFDSADWSEVRGPDSLQMK